MKPAGGQDEGTIFVCLFRKTMATTTFRNISDTALWVATYRAWESERPDALFRDPFARQLSGERGEQLAAAMRKVGRHAWSFTARTWLVDQFVARLVAEGADMVINLAAGLDTRPYRMQWPASLRWVEVDMPELLAFKQQVLEKEKAKCVCRLEQVPLDLTNVKARQELFQRLGREARNAAIVTEGLVAYFADEDAAALARDMALPASFHHWIMDLSSPALLKMMHKTIGGKLGDAGMPLKFAPREGPQFFLPHGWKALEACSLLHTAARLKRLPFWMRLLAWSPDSKGKKPDRPWGGVVLLERTRAGF
jgi:methyltransferase (TIGR00027 family)